MKNIINEKTFGILLISTVVFLCISVFALGVAHYVYRAELKPYDYTTENGVIKKVE